MGNGVLGRKVSLGRWLAIGALAVAPILGSHGVAYADGAADEADLHFEIGAEAYQKGEFRTALEHFLLSNRLVPNRNVVFNIARTYEQLKRYADAHRHYVDALDGETNQQTIATVNDAIKRIAPNVAVLRVESDPPGATIYLERKDLGSRGRAPKPLAVPEGKYKVIVELPGYEPATIEGVSAKVGSETKVQSSLKRIVGSVAVTVEGGPGAEVHIDEESAPPVCSAPCTFEVPPGPHLLYFTRDGFQAAPRQVAVVAKETVKAVAKLSPLTGAVVVQADERDAIVEIDGKPLGFTPAVIQNVAVGKRKLTVSLRGYAPIEKEVQVKANQQTQVLDLKLVPLRQVAAASRFTESIDDAPSSVTIIDGQELRAFGYPTIWEALRGVRGVSLSNDRAYQSASIRGLGEPNDYGNRMLVLSDGAVLNDNVLNSSYIGVDGRPDLGDIDRIEIVRGPGSLLYGAGAMSGVVNLVPRPKDAPSSVYGGGGTWDNSVAHGRLGFHYNFTPKVGAWASLSASRSDGVGLDVLPRDSALTDPPTTVTQADFHRAWGTAGRFWAGPLTAQWYYNQRKQHLTNGAYGVDLNDARSFVVDERFLGEVRFEPQLHQTLQLFLRAYANHYNYDGTFLYGGYGYFDHIQGTWVGGEARLVWSPVKDLRLTLGGEAQGHITVNLHGQDEGGYEYLNFPNVPYNLFAPYLVGEWGATSWLRLSAGARLNVYPDFEGDEPPVFRGAIILKPTKTTIIKMMGGNSFRAPSVYEQRYNDGCYAICPAIPGQGQVGADGVTPLNTYPIKSEQIFTGELEITQRFAEDWSVLGAGWVSQVSDIINSEIVDPNSNDSNPDPALESFTTRYSNQGAPALIAGFDVELRREWRQGWMLSGYYSFQKAQYLTEAGDPLAVNPRLVNAPEHLASVRGVVPIVPELASIGARFTLESGRRIDLASDETTRPAVVGDITVSGNLRKFGVGYVLGVYNVMDQRYDYPTAASFIGKVSRQNGRTLLLNLNIQYP